MDYLGLCSAFIILEGERFSNTRFEKRDVRLIKRGKNTFTQVRCEIAEQVHNQNLFRIIPVVSIPTNARAFPEFQLLEVGGRDTVSIITDETGKKFPVSWGSGSVVGFRTTDHILHSVEFLPTKMFGFVNRFQLIRSEGNIFLRRSKIGTFRVFREKVGKGNGLFLPSFSWRDEAVGVFESAIRAVISKWRCDCKKKDCASHFGLVGKEKAEFLKGLAEKKKEERSRGKVLEFREASAG